MIRRFIKAGLGLATALTALTACTVDVTWTPIGDDFSVQGAWLVNGAPADAASCAAAGIQTVRVVFIYEGTPYQYDNFTFPCSQGSFDTRPSYVLAQDSYITQWRAYDAAGNETHRGGELPLDLTAILAPGHVTLATADFEAAVVTPSLGVNIDFETVLGTVGADCAQADASLISYQLTEAGGAYTDMMTDVACGSRIDWAELPAGSYSLYLEGTASGGTKDWMATCDFTVAGATEVTCSLPWTSTDTILAVNLAWDTDSSAGGMVDGTCTEAGVEVWSYMLTDNGTGMNADSMFDIPCANGFYWRGLAAGSYRLYAEGGTAAVKNWMGTCDDLTVTAGTRTIANCAYDDMSGT